MAVVFALFAAYGIWRTPVPGVNEPHYLAKARHFDDPAWCARDVFLQSADAHRVFYATIGSLASSAPFVVAAWIGRVIVWLALAAGWVALARPMLTLRWGPVWSAAFFLAAMATVNLSGEWLVGGVEAKGVSYALLFSGVACALRGRPTCAGACLGGSISFHPVVGIWGLAALAFAFLLPLATRRPPLASGGEGGAQAEALPDDGSKSRTRSLKQLAAFAIACVLLSLPGLIPAVQMLRDPRARAAAAQADELQVFDRLDHHLDPRQFPLSAWGAYAAMVALWLTTRPWRANSAATQRFADFVLGTLAIALAGMIIGFGPRWAWALKFYPFRLADLFVPLAAATGVVAALARRTEPPGATPASGLIRSGLLPALAAVAFAWALAAPGNDRNPTRWSPQQHADWQAACRFIREQTPAEALFLTPRHNYTFKWYAQRAEYATWKDCPQDAWHLVEWKRRLDRIVRWRNTHFDAGFDDRALAELRAETGVDYVIDWYFQPYRREPIFRNRSFRVYQLAEVPR